jgi:hypothetical protein
MITLLGQSMVPNFFCLKTSVRPARLSMCIAAVGIVLQLAPAADRVSGNRIPTPSPSRVPCSLQWTPVSADQELTW